MDERGGRTAGKAPRLYRIIDERSASRSNAGLFRRPGVPGGAMPVRLVEPRRPRDSVRYSTPRRGMTAGT